MFRKTLNFILVFIAAASLWAGEMSNFVSLGFSPDSSAYLFGQYGVDSATNYSFCDLYFVDVQKNAFYRGAVFSKTYEQPTPVFNDGYGALLNLLRDKSQEVKRFEIDHLQTGRVVYLMDNGDMPKSEIQFRDFQSRDQYKVTLIQDIQGSEKTLRGAFHLRVSRTKSDGTTETYTAGLPNYYREDVMSYRIKQVMFSPDEKAIVFVMEKSVFQEGGNDIRYMVETLPLD